MGIYLICVSDGVSSLLQVGHQLQKSPPSSPDPAVLLVADVQSPFVYAARILSLTSLKRAQAPSPNRICST